MGIITQIDSAQHDLTTAWLASAAVSLSVALFGSPHGVWAGCLVGRRLVNRYSGDKRGNGKYFGRRGRRAVDPALTPFCPRSSRPKHVDTGTSKSSCVLPHAPVSLIRRLFFRVFFSRKSPRYFRRNQTGGTTSAPTCPSSKGSLGGAENGRLGTPAAAVGDGGAVGWRLTPTAQRPSSSSSSSRMYLGWRRSPRS